MEELDLRTLARSAASQPFWDGMADGRLLLPHCRTCAAAFFPPRRWCPRCHGSELEWREASGTGSVWAHSTVHTPFDLAVPVPYTALVVELAEGVRVPGMLTEASEVAVGDRVSLTLPTRLKKRLPLWRRA